MAVGPFSEYEQRFLLSEILKTSNIPIDALLNVLREQNFDPTWEEVGLPAGRSMNSCAAELAKLNSSPSGDSNPDSAKQTSRGIKRTLSASAFYGPATPATKAREIKPKPAAASNGADKPVTSTPATGSARKRGRPSNAELAQRAKEASERGEAEKGVYATKRKSISDQSVGEPPAPGSEPPAKRGRGRPPKNKAPVANPGVDVEEESKPSEADTDVAAPADPEPEPVVNDKTPQDDAATKETRQNLEVVARAASATVSEALAPQPQIAPSNTPAPTTSAFKKIFGLSSQTPTTQAPPPEQAIGAAAH
ncbi:hypothetical protein VE01_02489 [Pseudogymnoascus verrucosus]|uniref:Uncharacterized protein n=1 Tax=Pseudogymnoascus verrucosus TaxID=342668 RepID=A0A1B8GST6_9PEZI|nr:uncharacterized protein VE01_02489 [Pseudogymnoascus verrucosus]OBT98891.1 hypothetical protein VE01_02489 [Pseudogymnoascus verrucosus]